MKNRFKTLYLILILIAGLASACSSPPSENAAPANSNTAQPGVPENGTPSATSSSNQSPNVVSASGEVTTTKVEAQPAPATAPQAAAPTTAIAEQVRTSGLPKIVVPVKKINFGKQPQDKLLTRTFVVKNTGKSELKIEAVEPS